MFEMAHFLLAYDGRRGLSLRALATSPLPAVAAWQPQVHSGTRPTRALVLIIWLPPG
jgi:hypothetical protein